MSNISDYFGGGGGGAVTEVSAIASGAIPNGAPCIQGGDGKVKVASGNIAQNVADDAQVTQGPTNSTNLQFFNPISVVDRAAGRGIVIANRGPSYNYEASLKLWDVNTTTGLSGGNGTGANTNIRVGGSAYNHYRYPQGAVWDNSQGCWFSFHRGDGSASYGLMVGKTLTSNGYTVGNRYGHAFGSSNQYAIYSSFTGTTRVVKDTENGYIYMVTCGNTQAYGRDSCLVHGPFTWTSDANSGGAFAGTALATDYTPGGYNVSADAAYDSLNNQIIVVTSKSVAGNDQTLYAFDINQANGTPTYSHYLQDAGGTVAGQIRSLECDDAGNVVWSELNSKKLYAAKNTGSAFVKGNSISWAAGASAQTSMRYNPTYKSWVASYINDTSGSGAAQYQKPNHLIYAVGNGNISNKTLVTVGTGEQAGAYAGSNTGFIDNATSSFKIGGNYSDTTDTFVQYTWGYSGSGNVAYMNSNRIATSNVYTGSYIGLAKAAIADGASGKITTKNAINESQSGLTSGLRYGVTALGVVKSEGSMTDAEAVTAVFLGTATDSDKIFVGNSLNVIDSGAVHNDVPKVLTHSGIQAGVVSSYWTDALGKAVAKQSVTATGSNSIFKVSGTGTVLFFYMSNDSTSSSDTNVDVFFDGVQLFNTGTLSTSYTRCLSIVGEFHARVNGTGQGVYHATNTGYTFNKSFEVRRNSLSSTTSFAIAYKILGN